jgi:hypothetical protein
MLREKILYWLSAHPNQPQSVEQLAAAIPGTSKAELVDECELLRSEALLGRNGANSVASPFRFYLRAHLRSKRP